MAVQYAQLGMTNIRVVCELFCLAARPTVLEATNNYKEQ